MTNPIFPGIVTSGHYEMTLTANITNSASLASVRWYIGIFKYTSIPRTLRAARRRLTYITTRRNSV